MRAAQLRTKSGITRGLRPRISSLGPPVRGQRPRVKAQPPSEPPMRGPCPGAGSRGSFHSRNAPSTSARGGRSPHRAGASSPSFHLRQGPAKTLQAPPLRAAASPPHGGEGQLLLLLLLPLPPPLPHGAQVELAGVVEVREREGYWRSVSTVEGKAPHTAPDRGGAGDPHDEADRRRKKAYQRRNTTHKPRGTGAHMAFPGHTGALLG